MSKNCLTFRWCVLWRNSHLTQTHHSFLPVCSSSFGVWRLNCDLLLGGKKYFALTYWDSKNVIHTFFHLCFFYCPLCSSVVAWNQNIMRSTASDWTDSNHFSDHCVNVVATKPDGPAGIFLALKIMQSRFATQWCMNTERILIVSTLAGFH